MNPWRCGVERRGRVGFGNQVVIAVRSHAGYPLWCPVLDAPTPVQSCCHIWSLPQPQPPAVFWSPPPHTHSCCLINSHPTHPPPLYKSFVMSDSPPPSLPLCTKLLSDPPPPPSSLHPPLPLPCTKLLWWLKGMRRVVFCWWFWVGFKDNWRLLCTTGASESYAAD